MSRWLAIVLCGLLSGCLATTTAPLDTDAPPPTPLGPYHVLEGTLEPAELVAPAFKLLGAVGRAGPPGGAGEPSIWAHLDGTIYLTFPGCDNGNEPPSTPLTPRSVCRNGVLLRSDDDGATWKKLNKAPDGKLTSDGPNANGDAEVTVDAAGTVYASNLGSGGIQMWRSGDRGESWTHLGNATPRQNWADRQWQTAGAPGHMIVNWMGGKSPAGQTPRRAVMVNTTFDGGANWTGVAYIDDAIGTLGPSVLNLNSSWAAIPYMKSVRGASPTSGAGEFTILFARSFDGGRTWESVPTGVKIATSAHGGHWTGAILFPVIDVTSTGRLVMAWAEDVVDPTGITSNGARIRITTTDDWGTTWTPPVTVTTRNANIMPWISGGAGDRAVLTYYASDLPGDTDYLGRWDVMATVIDGAGTSAPRLAHSIIDRDIHYGGVCARGTACQGSDRTLLDFFENDVLPDGRIVVTYAADPHTQGKYAQIRAAIQNGGTPLFVR